jgi:hypothetical protein
MQQTILSILTHEYTLTLYGVILWQIEQCIEFSLTFDESIKKMKRNVFSSLIWVGLIVVFDDELLARYNEVAHVDYEDAPYFMYMLGGFLIDFFRTKYKDFKKENVNVDGDSV